MGSKIGNIFTKITDFKTIILEKVLEQYKGKPNFDKIFDIFADNLQEIENVIYDIYTKRWIADATGKQLDEIGYNLSTSRQGLDDDDYRQVLFGKIGQYNSNGTIEDIIKVTTLLTNAELVQVTEVYPAKNSINIVGDSLDLNDSFLSSAISGTMAGGVGVDSIVITENTPYFKFNNLAGSDIDAEAEGFSSLSLPDNGGFLSELL